MSSERKFKFKNKFKFKFIPYSCRGSFSLNNSFFISVNTKLT